MEGMNKPQLFLLASLALFISSWKYKCLWNHEATELWSIFQIWYWCGQQPLVMRQSEVAGSFLWQGPFNGKDMKKNKLPSSTKSDSNLFKVFWADHWNCVSSVFFRGLLRVVVIRVQRLVWQCAGTLNISLREESSLFVPQQHHVNCLCFPPCQYTNLPKSLLWLHGACSFSCKKYSTGQIISSIALLPWVNLYRCAILINKCSSNRKLEFISHALLTK